MNKSHALGVRIIRIMLILIVLLKIKLNEQDVKEAFRKTKNTRDIG